MIHVLRVGHLPDLVVAQVCRRLFMSYAVGVEPVTDPLLLEGDELDGPRLLAEMDFVPPGKDDRTLALTDKRVLVPSGPLGPPPQSGYSERRLRRAVVTLSGIPMPSQRGGEETEEDWLAFADRVARRAVHQIGLLWSLHRCPDRRCAMSVPWLDGASPELCEFCRGRSEERIRRTLG